MSWFATGRTYVHRWLVGMALAGAAAASVAWVYFLGLELVRGIIWTLEHS